MREQMNTDVPAQPNIPPIQRQLWRVLDDLAICRKAFGLTHSSLSVLRALISFLPKDDDKVLPSLIVWPSNRTLSDRADGMEERTLRRHLARLCDAGLITRHSSANGKRFALRLRKSVVTAFGFCLNPLLDMAQEIAAAADSLHLKAEQTRLRKASIHSLLQQLATSDSATVITPEHEAEIRRMLRRDCDCESLDQVIITLRHLTGSGDDIATEMSASNSQIVRHQQNTKKENLDSVSDRQVQTSDESSDAMPCDDLKLTDCLEAADDAIALSPEPVRNWADLARLADTLAPMIGIGFEVMNHSRRAMGPIVAAVSVLCLVGKTAQIHRPSAYLRKLAQLAEAGKFSLKAMLRSAVRQRFAGVNRLTSPS